jgi:polyferredoxin
MTKMKRPLGLIRYTSQDALEKRRLDKRALLRARTVIYPTILVGLLTALVLVGSTRTVADLTLLRGIGAPFVEEGTTVRNHVRIKIQNRTGGPKDFFVELKGADGATFIAPENPVHVAPGERVTSSVFVVADRSFYPNGTRSVRFVISDHDGFEQTLPYKLLGPESAP